MNNFKKILLFSAVAIGISSTSYSMDSELGNGCPKKGYASYAISKILHPITSAKEVASYFGQTSLAKIGLRCIASSLSTTDYVGENIANYISSTYMVRSYVPCFVKNIAGGVYGTFHYMLNQGANYFGSFSSHGHHPFSPKIEDSFPISQDGHHHSAPCHIGHGFVKPGFSYADALRKGLKDCKHEEIKTEHKPSTLPSKPKPHYCIENPIEEPRHTTKPKVYIDDEGFQLVGHHKGSRRANCWGAPMPETVKFNHMTKRQKFNQLVDKIKKGEDCNRFEILNYVDENGKLKLGC